MRHRPSKAVAAICGSGSSGLRPARPARISAATATNWSIMSLWWASSDGAAWIRVPKRRIAAQAWARSSCLASQDLMPEHDDREQYLAGINLILAGITTIR